MAATPRDPDDIRTTGKGSRCCAGARRWLLPRRLRVVRFALDSPLEEAGFEPLVPRKTPAVVVISGLVTPPSLLRQSRADTSPSLETLVV
jgi:hypothetical protein